MYVLVYLYISFQCEEMISYEQIMPLTVQIRKKENAYKIISLSFVCYSENSIEYRNTLVLHVYVRALRGMR